MSHKSSRPISWGVVFTTFIIASPLANADTLTFGSLKIGNATSLEKDVKKTDAFHLSNDKTKLVKNDNQFSMTTSFALEDGQNGESTIVPYAGSENTRYENANLDYGLGDLRFGATNLAVWLGKEIEMVKDLGFLQNKPMDLTVYSQCKDMLNSYFNPRDNLICVGHLMDTLGRKAMSGMASMAWDADVMAHEMGHGIFHHVSTMTEDNYFSFGNDMLGAMNEGQADFFAHTVTGTVELAPWMMNMAKEYFKKKNPAVYERIKNERSLRVINNHYLLNHDSFREIHDDGRIFAGSLYDLGTKLGNQQALQLWLTSIAKVQEASNFYDLSQFVIDADQELNQGKNQQTITEVFTHRGILGNPDLKKSDLKVVAKVVDGRKDVANILRQLGVSEVMIFQITAGLNNNGTLDKGECVSVELSFKNTSNHDLVGLELFSPKHLLPEGAVNQGQNRNYIGYLKSGEVYPKTIDFKDEMRPWLFVCADRSYNSANPLQVVLRTSSEGFLQVPVNL